MSYEPLHHKYRPQTFAELVGQEAIATTLTNALQTAKIAPAYLFTGSRGTGKTSSARILAKSLNCLASQVPTAKPCGTCEVCQGITNGSALDVIEIDAASNTGVDNIRELIERAQFAPVQCRYKVYIIDEVHMLSTAAFNALLKTLEEPPARIVFVLATTDPQRVLPTIISRCQRFDFRRIRLDAMVKHLSAIAHQENINITGEAVQLVAQVAQGGLRDAESLLDQLSLLSTQVTVERVWDLVGSVAEPDLIELLQAIAQNIPQSVLECTRKIMDRGREPLTVLQNLAGFYRDLLIAKTAPNRSDLVAVTPFTWKALSELAKVWDIPTILSGQQHLAKSEVQIKNTTQPRLWLEVTLLGLLAVENSTQQQISKKTTEIRQHEDKITLSPSSPPTSSSPLAPQQNHSEPNIEPVSIPKPVAIELQSAVTTPESNALAQTPKEQVWQQVLDNLHPNSTRALLRQMGHLLEFNGTFARIGMKSPAWCNQAKAYLPNIKAAFQQTFNQDVQVSLELATQNKTSTNRLLTPITVSAPVNSLPISPVSTSISASNSIEAPILTQPQPVVTAFPTLTEPETFTTSDDVAIAAQSLADGFKGEIIKLQDHPVPQPLAVQTDSNWNNADLDIDGEADIEF